MRSKKSKRVAGGPVEDAWRRMLERCVICDAPRGKPCRTSSGKVTQPHRYRRPVAGSPQ